MSQTVNTLPAIQETWAQFLGLKDPLEKEMATHSSILGLTLGGLFLGGLLLLLLLSRFSHV